METSSANSIYDRAFSHAQTHHIGDHPTRCSSFADTVAEIVTGAIEVVFGELTKVYWEGWEMLHCFDDDPADVETVDR